MNRARMGLGVCLLTVATTSCQAAPATSSAATASGRVATSATPLPVRLDQWSAVPAFATAFGFSDQVTEAVYANQLLAAGISQGTLTVERSSNGSTWVPVAIPGTSGVTFTGTPLLSATPSSVLLIAAAGPGVGVWVSTDGQSFTRAGSLPYRPHGPQWIDAGPTLGGSTPAGVLVVGSGDWFSATSTVFQGLGLDGWVVRPDGTATELAAGVLISYAEAVAGMDASGGLAITRAGTSTILFGGVDYSSGHTGPAEPTAWTSANDGGTWARSARSAIAAGPTGTATMVHGAAAAASVAVACGEVVTSRGGAFAPVRTPPTYRKATTWTSTDGGVTWSADTSVATAPMSWASAITATPGGFLLAVEEPASGTTSPAPGGLSSADVTLMLTSSDGATWGPPVTAAGIDGDVSALTFFAGHYIAIGKNTVSEYQEWVSG